LILIEKEHKNSVSALTTSFKSLKISGIPCFFWNWEIRLVSFWCGVYTVYSIYTLKSGQWFSENFAYCFSMSASV